MIKKKLNKIVGLKFDDFQSYLLDQDKPQIQVREARLIPTLKTGDECALTSIFLSSLRLVKEYRYESFKE